MVSLLFSIIATLLTGSSWIFSCGALGNASARSIVYTISGTHGIEGYAGSMAQISMLRGPTSMFPQDVRMVHVHLINPYGVSHILEKQMKTMLISWKTKLTETFFCSTGTQRWVLMDNGRLFLSIRNRNRLSNDGHRKHPFFPTISACRQEVFYRIVDWRRWQTPNKSFAVYEKLGPTMSL